MALMGPLTVTAMYLGALSAMANVFFNQDLDLGPVRPIVGGGIEDFRFSSARDVEAVGVPMALVTERNGPSLAADGRRWASPLRGGVWNYFKLRRPTSRPMSARFVRSRSTDGLHAAGR